MDFNIKVKIKEEKSRHTKWKCKIVPFSLVDSICVLNKLLHAISGAMNTCHMAFAGNFTHLLSL